MKKMIIAMVMALCSLGISAQTENGFKEIEVQDSFVVNPFTYFRDGLLLAAGDKDGYKRHDHRLGQRRHYLGQEPSADDSLCGPEEIHA